MNPCQIPVMAVDAPLYCIHWPNMFSGSGLKRMARISMWSCSVVFILKWQCGIHIWDYLEASGWTTVLTEAGIAYAGIADSFLKASHLTRTRHAHQVSALLWLQPDAFLHMVKDGPYDEKTKDAGRHEMITRSPTFHYWDTILHMEMLGLIFVRAHREQDSPLHVE
jgi:hypothetical protein